MISDTSVEVDYSKLSNGNEKSKAENYISYRKIYINIWIEK